MKRLFLLVWVVILSTSAASARTWYVKPDGSGDVPSIKAAVDLAAAEGDTVLLADGTFSGAGNRQVDCGAKALVIVSESHDPELCSILCSGTIDCSDNLAAFYFRASAAGAQRLEGVTITGWCGGVICDTSSCPAIVNCVFYDNWCMAAEIGFPGAGMRCLENSRPTITDCTFRHNQAMAGAGIVCTGSSPVLTNVHFIDNVGGAGAGMSCGGGTSVLTSCEFSENRAGNPWAFSAGAGLCCGSAELTNCIFRENVCYGVGGGLCFVPISDSDRLVLHGCAFLDNRAEESNMWTGGGGVAAWNYEGHSGEVSIANCTFVGNGSYKTTYAGGALLIIGSSAVSVTSTVIALGGAGGAVGCSGPATPALACCDIFGNAGGDWAGCVAAQYGVSGNFSADPLFCDVPTGNLGVEDCSPCLPGHHPNVYDCVGVIGAFGPECDCGTATQPTTWGTIKAMYR